MTTYACTQCTEASVVVYTDKGFICTQCLSIAVPVAHNGRTMNQGVSQPKSSMMTDGLIDVEELERWARL